MWQWTPPCCVACPLFPPFSLPSVSQCFCDLWVSCLLWAGLGQFHVLSPSQTGGKIIRYVIGQIPLSRFSLLQRVCLILAGPHPGLKEPLFSLIPPLKGEWHVFKGSLHAQHLALPQGPVVLPSMPLLILGETISPFSSSESLRGSLKCPPISGADFLWWVPYHVSSLVFSGLHSHLCAKPCAGLGDSEWLLPFKSSLLGSLSSH